MNWANQNQIIEGSRFVIAGQEKLGKTTLVAGAPRALFVPLEIGYRTVKVQKTPMIQKYQEFIGLLNDIENGCKSGQFPFQSLVVDSLTALERMIHTHIVDMETFGRKGTKGVTMETAMGGYGKAYVQANDLYSEVLNTFDRLAVNHGINIVVTCHVFASQVNDPQHGQYDSWDLLLHTPKDQKRYGKRELTTQWADFIGFLFEPLHVTETNGVRKGISAQKGRLLGVSRTPSYVAGNRFGLEGEIVIPKEFGWNALAKSIYDVCGIDFYNREV